MFFFHQKNDKNGVHNNVSLIYLKFVGELMSASCLVGNMLIYPSSVDRVSVPLPIAADICDGMQWQLAELTCICFLCKFRTAHLYTYYHKYKVLFEFFRLHICAVY